MRFLYSFCSEVDVKWRKKRNPVAGTTTGNPHLKIVYAIIGTVFVIIAVVMAVKFCFGTDLLNPAGGQMSLVQRPVSTIVRPDVTISGQVNNPGITAAEPMVKRVATDIPRLSPCAVNQSDDCNGSCVFLQTDPKNCGSCGNTCHGYPNATGSGCSGGKCILTCSAGHGDCNHSSADGCETCIKYDINNCGTCGNHCPDGTFCYQNNCMSKRDINTGQNGLPNLDGITHQDNGDLVFTEPSCD